MRILLSSKLFFRFLLGFLTGSALFFTGCAPQNGDDVPEATDAGSTETPDESSPDRPDPAGEEDEKDAKPTVKSEPDPTPKPKERFDPEDPDWSLRYRMLKEHFDQKFEPKNVVGKTLTIPLASGEARVGTITALGRESLDLEFENGAMTLHADAMREDAQKYFFRKYFAHLNAVEQAKDEHAKWTAMKERESRPRPKPKRPTREVAGGPLRPRTQPDSGNPDGLPHGYKPDPKADPPKNDGPKGRVWQVDSYLRRNSAVPHSLRYKKWFPLQKHGDGYKVRVQYSVESAGGMGTSQEDMMFFMYKDGKVYQRAAVR